ncbi:Hypothetical predicted protein, partial [Pelobates cultripes]
SAEMPDPCQALKIFTDLLAVTLQFWKSMSPHCELKAFPAKLLLHYNNAIHGATFLEAGIAKLKDCGLPPPDAAVERATK